MASNIQLAHGGGGLLSSALIDEEILPRFGTGPLNGLPDAASISTGADTWLFSTDSFVVQPLEFPGGCIGDLAVHGTVNDIAVAGGQPQWLSLAMILEEGLPFDLLRRVLDAVRDAAADCRVTVATGDTKVVAKGQCDGLYITTAGIGKALPHFNLAKNRITPGDAVVVSGTIGDHGMAVMTAREDIRITNGPTSDTGPVHRLAADAHTFAEGIRFMRDPTRGGVAAVLNEMVTGQAVGITLEEHRIPTAPGTRAVAEMMGIDLLSVACEGRVIAICSADCAADLVATWQQRPEGRGTCIVGHVTNAPGRVVLQTLAGGQRLVDVPLGELLPRIC